MGTARSGDAARWFYIEEAGYARGNYMRILRAAIGDLNSRTRPLDRKCPRLTFPKRVIEQRDLCNVRLPPRADLYCASNEGRL